ncbi:DUF742 domain-containing protein [Streptomyces sp. NBRC 109706]|uniref:DUF742 domain-containing protein n=1 Tax=Streptomyces sp. NBRC 109706 TaxID=1550035 RepID=UPI000AEA4EEB
MIVGDEGQEDESPSRRKPDDDQPVPLYVVTGGRSESKDALALDLVTLVVARADPQAGQSPEHAALLRMCRYPISVAEISAYVGLPFSAVIVLLMDLLDSSQVDVRQTRVEQHAAAADPDLETLKALIDGLQRL